MEMIIFSSFFCCIIHAYSLSINYTILHTNLAWDYDTSPPIYPVLMNGSIPLANENFSLSFITRSKEKYELGIFMIIDNTEPEMIWSAGKIVSEKSRLELDDRSGRRIILRNESNEEVWSAGHNVSSWELKSGGNLLLYDANRTVVWSSMDYSTDIVLVGQNFTQLRAGNATAMFQDGNFMVNASSTLSLCQIWKEDWFYSISSWAEVSVKGQFRYGTSNDLQLRSFNSSGLPTGSDIQIFGNATVTYSFIRIRLYEDASFMLYGLQNGMWVRSHACCFNYNFTNWGPTNCTVQPPQPSKPQPWRKNWAACILIILVLLMFELQYFWIFKNQSRTICSLVAIIISSISATSIVIYKLLNFLLVNEVFSYNLYRHRELGVLSTFAIDLIILQTSSIFLLKWIKTSPKFIATLVLLHMLLILSSYAYIALELLSLWYLMPWVLSFYFYPWPVVNTICLLVRWLPGHRCYNRYNPIFFVVLNFFVVCCCAAIAYVDLCHPSLYAHYNRNFSAIILNVLSFIFMLVSAWAFYIHYMKATVEVNIKRILLWLLLGRRRSEPSDIITMSLSSFSYPELEVVTNNFSNMVGKGGFGGVYEGTLLDGKRVAIKKLESNSQGLQEFKSEIETLGKIHHVHLVELLGFCAEGPHKLLVYEFMANGSLDKWIFSDHYALDWRSRMQILLGTAQGLAYLHEECEPKILHLDVKPQNILLDDSFNAKVSDFGLCKLLPGDKTSILLTRMMGTFGYLPPEWVNGTVSEKHDVYSFGIVILETLSGRKSNATIALDEDGPYFLEWVMKAIENGTLIDHMLMQEDYHEEQSKGVIEIALLCIKEDANMRPSMKRVVKLMEDQLDSVLDGVRQVNGQNTLYSTDEECALL